MNLILVELGDESRDKAHGNILTLNILSKIKYYV